MKIQILGAGYVGVHTAIEIYNYFKDKENLEFVFIDKNKHLIENINDIIEKYKELNSDIYKTLLIDFVKKRDSLKRDDEFYLKFLEKCEFKEGKFLKYNLDYNFVCINTPDDPKKTIELFKNIFISKEYNNIIVRSTIPIGLMEFLKSYVYTNKLAHIVERFSPQDREYSTIGSGDIEIYKKFKEAFKIKKWFNDFKITEYTKLIENTYKYFAISFMNLSLLIANDFNINFDLAMEALKTKEGVQYYTPGLIGGECIGFDQKLIDNDKITSFDFLYSGYNEKLYNLIKDRLLKKIFYYRPENIIWVGIEYKPNAYTTQNSKNYEIYEKIKQETLRANLKINKMKLLTKENLEKIINENQLDIFENKKIIILVNHDETEIIREKFKENIIFDIKNLGTEIVLNDKLI
jgi:UDP-N-acetyl-D-mannosaminuronate dehydrogenase